MSEPTPTDAPPSVEQVERERDEFLELLRRTQADFENARQRFQRERDQERRYAAGPLAKDLFAALDNLERALESAQSAAEGGALAEGVAMVHQQILDALKRHGIVPMQALHQPFDPNYHQAVTQMPSPQYPPNTVTQVLQQGYQLHERVLRPASVILAAPTS
jgi:molecular chaperone GrpE